jgi:hypothetical protein
MEFHDAFLESHSFLVGIPGRNDSKRIGSCLSRIAHPLAVDDALGRAGNDVGLDHARA